MAAAVEALTGWSVLKNQLHVLNQLRGVFPEGFRLTKGDKSGTQVKLFGGSIPQGHAQNHKTGILMLSPFDNTIKQFTWKGC